MMPNAVGRYIEERLEKMEGWCTRAKATALAETVLREKPSVAVEIGVFGGRSLFALALAMKENGHGVAWGIDPWTVESALEGDTGPENEDWWKNKVNLEEIYIGFVEAALEFELTFNCRWIRERSEVAVSMWPDKSIDFLHLDSNHSELVSCRDVDLWAPKMAKNAIWAMDDTDWPPQMGALKKIHAHGFSLTVDGGTYQILKRG